MAVGKNITWNNGKAKQYHLSFNIRDVGKDIKCGRGDWNGNFREENQELTKNGDREEYQVVGNFIHP